YVHDVEGLFVPVDVLLVIFNFFLLFFFFFFQAEDGIRDFHVTGVQTCALPIYSIPGTNHDNRVNPVGGELSGAGLKIKRPPTGGLISAETNYDETPAPCGGVEAAAVAAAASFKIR